ncbi:hypothetical protein GPECTOR_102g71 [Gonium pectorale]|uniref:UMP kinase n=1 Tax=Gonium pectorale TaxID=33097 RepID=A0A150FZW5_GONPE|nr:hypothetical protein GPECTOR_102g71 [Gonium pectorale]|eukprot:KXZ43118.1 hypothetical protein GPECTOR_102g71 [Gonium pectorale]
MHLAAKAGLMVGGGLASARPCLCQHLLRIVRTGPVTAGPSAVCRSGHVNGATIAVAEPNGCGHPDILHASGHLNQAFHSSFIIGSPSESALESAEQLNDKRQSRDNGSSASTSSSSHAASSPPATPGRPAYKYPRVLLKISGEALQGKLGGGVDPGVLSHVAEEIAEAHRAGLQLAVVVGGGNYFRGASAPKGMDRAQADYVGMLATVMNALLLQGALEALGVDTRVQTAIEMREVAEPYIRRRAIRHLQENRVVIFGAGTGNPFFTTDTAAALRAAEMNADVFMKATKVDGVYDCDPMKHQHAKKYDKLSYRQVSVDNLQVMDETAITLCKENNIPVLVFNVMDRGNVVKAARGENVGTVVASEDVKGY